MKKLEQIVKFDSEIQAAVTIKDLDLIYNKVTFSDLDNYTVTIFNHLINLKGLFQVMCKL